MTILPLSLLLLAASSPARAGDTESLSKFLESCEGKVLARRRKPVFVNVLKDCGAQGKEDADDTAAIQRAIDAVPRGATVVFPPGTYVIRETLVIRKPLVLAGSGSKKSTLRLAGAPKPLLLVQPTCPADGEVTVSGLRLAGTCEALESCQAGSSGAPGVQLSAADSCAFDQILLNNNTVERIAGDAIAVGPSVAADAACGNPGTSASSIRIRGNVIREWARDRHAVRVNDASDVTVSDNEIRGGGEAGGGVRLEPARRLRGAQVFGNRVRTSGTGISVMSFRRPTCAACPETDGIKVFGNDVQGGWPYFAYAGTQPAACPVKVTNHDNRWSCEPAAAKVSRDTEGMACRSGERVLRPAACGP
jgi:hypothetical protein